MLSGSVARPCSRILRGSQLSLLSRLLRGDTVLLHAASCELTTGGANTSVFGLLDLGLGLGLDAEGKGRRADVSGQVMVMVVGTC